MAAPPLYTIGHSTLAVQDFIALLQREGVTRVIDVRAIPRSLRQPQFHEDRLPAALAAQGIAYTHMPALGGRRSLQRGVPPTTNGYWDNRSFHNYADYALQPAFRAALAALRMAAAREPCAIMCAEAVWWRCHRRIITDHVLAAGGAVRHILGARTESATLTPAAQVHPDGTVTYPPPTTVSAP